MIGLSKSRILAHRQCPKRLWLQINRPELAGDAPETTALMAAGGEVGEVARSLHPDGVLIDGADLAQALADTARELTGDAKPLFEATFDADGVLVRADLLLPDGAGHRLVEVKSSTRVKDYHLEDAAVQAWVAREAGVAITVVEIAHIDNRFVYPGGGDYRGLFHHTDISAEVETRLPQVPGWIAAARDTLAGGEPELAAGDQCRAPFECPFLGYCAPPPVEDGYPPEILPRAGALAAALRAEGFDDLRQVPGERLSHPKHLRILRASCSEQAELDSAAGAFLAALPFPRFYLDFETIAFAVPRWAGTRPYQQVPFQWSCHIESAPGVVAAQAFLVDGEGDPRRAFAGSLVTAIGAEQMAGPILVYNAAFERTRLLELAATFPDLAPALQAAADRLIDLLPIARDHYYHPAMRGSWSLKAVLPTVAPELAYTDLEVADGGMAQEAYAEILNSETPPERHRHLRAALLDYCGRDTWGLVRLAWFFEGRDA